MACIDIVLAAYNGERFIEEQINSIQKNIGYADLIARFIIVDDGSTDGTVSIVERLQRNDNKIEIHHNNSKKTGPQQNFEFGINLTTAEYIMLSDQDDVWLPSKIKRTFEEARYQSKEVKSAPLVVFSDLKVVDEELNPIAESYFSHKNISKKWYQEFDNLLQQNVASGCTMMFNRALIEVALPIPEKAYMHDWWLILVAKKFGQLIYIDEPLLLYRQHGSNTIGAKSLSLRSYTIDLRENIKQFYNSFESICIQAQVFETRFQLELPDSTLACLSNWRKLRRIEKFKAFIQGKIWRSNLLSNVLLIICSFNR